MLILQTQVCNRSIKIDIILLAWKKFNFYVNYSSLKFKKFRIAKRKLRKKGKKKNKKFRNFTCFEEFPSDPKR